MKRTSDQVPDSGAFGMYLRNQDKTGHWGIAIGIKDWQRSNRRKWQCKQWVACANLICQVSLHFPEIV